VVTERPEVTPRDALRYAVMQRNGITRIITADTHFSSLPGIERVDPREALGPRL